MVDIRCLVGSDGLVVDKAEAARGGNASRRSRLEIAAFCFVGSGREPLGRGGRLRRRSLR